MDFFGLDIGSTTTKFTKLRQISRNKYRIENAVIMQTPQGGLSVESEAGLATMAETIKRGMDEAKITTKRVAATLPESDLFTRIISMPKMSNSELQSAIPWEAEQNIPLSLPEVNYSYNVVDTLEDGSMQVMIIAAPKKLVRKYEKVFSLAELTPVALESNLLAASRSLIGLTNNPPTLLMIMGAKTTEIGIVKNSNLIFTRSIATAGDTFTKSLMTTLQLEINQAESYKRTYGLSSQLLEGKVADSLRPAFDTLTRELQRTLSYYETQSGGTRINMIIITGGSASLPDFSPMLAEKLNLEVQIGNPLRQIDTEKGMVISPELLPSYAVSIGIAMKEL